MKYDQAYLWYCWRCKLEFQTPRVRYTKECPKCREQAVLNGVTTTIVRKPIQELERDV